MTTALPTTPEEFADALADPARMGELFDEGVPTPDFGEFVRGYANTLRKEDRDISRQVKEQVQAELATFLRNGDSEGSVPLNLKPGDQAAKWQTARSMAKYNPNAPGASLDGEFTSSADYLRTIWHNTDRDVPETRARITKIRNAFSSLSPSSGGFLVPETMRAELLSVALESSVVRSRARVIPMESARVPFPSIDATSNVSSVFGGIVGYWTEEGAALTISQAAFSRIVLDAKKLTAYTEVPNELVSDSAISLQAFIDEMFPEALSFYEDDGFTNGSGVGMPLGYLNADAAVSVAKEVGQTAGTIVWENLVNMFSRMLPGSLSRCTWVAAIDTFPQLATMALSVGTGGAPVWLTDGTSGAPMTILGRPVVFTEKCPKLGAAGDINLVDFGYYLVGDRQMMTATSSEHYKFGNDLTAYRIIERVDGRPWLNSAITPKNNSANTLSPFVKIVAR